MNDNDFFIGMLIVLLIFGVVELTALMEGSTRDDIRIEHITQAFEVCEPNGGLLKIEGESIGAHEFICDNGAVFTYVLPKKDTEQ